MVCIHLFLFPFVLLPPLFLLPFLQGVCCALSASNKEHDDAGHHAADDGGDGDDDDDGCNGII